jgi:II/X family phage/plasmid replication protein
MMVDWVTADLPSGHDPEILRSGTHLRISQHGEIEYVKHLSLEVKGSFDSGIYLSSQTDRTIRIFGNPAKFLQGHNIFGPHDLLYLVSKTFKKLCSNPELGLKPSDSDLKRIDQGDYRLFRVDVNETWLLDSPADCRSFVRALGKNATLKHRGAGQLKSDTAYFGLGSSHGGLRCYYKGDEISAKGHRIHPDLQIPELMEFASKAVRFERFMYSKMLKSLRLEYARDWTADTPKVLLFKYLNDLELPDNMPIPDEKLNAMPLRLKGVYSLWLAGHDLRTQMSSSAFYRWRKQLLAYGIDISLVQEGITSNIVPMIRILEAVPAEIPQWAYDKGLVA